MLKSRPSSPTPSTASSTDSWCKRYIKKPSVGADRVLTWRSNNSYTDSSEGEEDNQKPAKISMKNRNKKPYFPNKYQWSKSTLPLRPFVYPTFNDNLPEPEDYSSDEENLSPDWKFERMDWFGFSEGFYCGHEVQLNYLHLPKDLKQPNVKLDVLHEEDDLHLPIDISENINEILSWIMASFPRPALFNKTYPDVLFVCSRLELDNIMSSAYLHDPRFRYHDQNGFIISAVRLRGKIYLSTFYTNEEKLSRQIKHITLDLPQSSIAGLMFHKSVFSDVQDKEPDVNTAFDRKRVELFAVEILKTGTHSVLMQNKFKAVRSEDDLKELQEFKMFDVKTGFKPHKLYNLFRKWLRCFSGNMSSMIMGIKDSQCLKIKEIEEYTEDALLQMCQELYVSQIPALERSGVTLHPRREVCVSQAKRFLNLVSTIITADTPEDTVYTFSFDPEYPGKFDCFKLVGPASNHYRFISKNYYNWLNTQKLLK